MAKINKETVVCLSLAEIPGNFGANFHNTAYDALNLNWIYIPRKADKLSCLGKIINGIRALEIRGCSISMPYKEAIIPYLDDIDIHAQKIGAVNTVKQSHDGILKGYNTDYYGAKKALEKIGIKEKQVLLIGAGGAARAVGLAVKELGNMLTIANRTLDRAKELSKKLNANIISWKNLSNASGYVLINATSVGMKNSNKMVVNENIIRNFDIVMDIVTYPVETKLLRVSKGMGKKIIPGTLMCVYQAAEQFKIYTGFDAPQEIVNRTIKAFE